jgi:hypothetical protein
VNSRRWAWVCAASAYWNRQTRDREGANDTTVETAASIRTFNADIAPRPRRLGRRIAESRWPSKEVVEDRSQGVQLATLQALARYWLEEYDFGGSSRG